MARRRRECGGQQGPGSSSCEVSEHQPLLADLAAGRTQDAIDRMLRHLERIEARLDLDQVIRKPVDLGEVFGAAAGGGRR